MDNVFSSTITISVVSARGSLANTQEFAQCIRELGAKLRTIVGGEPLIGSSGSGSKVVTPLTGGAGVDDAAEVAGEVARAGERDRCASRVVRVAGADGLRGAQEAGAMRLVGAEGVVGGVGGREELARTVDRERVLSDMRRTVRGGCAEIPARGPKVQKSAKSAGVSSSPTETATYGRGRGPPMCIPVFEQCKSKTQMSVAKRGMRQMPGSSGSVRQQARLKFTAVGAGASEKEGQHYRWCYQGGT